MKLPCNVWASVVVTMLLGGLGGAGSPAIASLTFPYADLSLYSYDILLSTP